MLVAVSGASLVPPSMAQDKPGAQQPIKLAVVNLIDLQQASKAWLSIRDQSQGLVKRFRAEALKERARLQKVYQNLERQCAVRSIQWCRRARVRINQQAQEFQRLNQVRRQQLGRSLQKARNKLLLETRRVVKAISVEKGYTLVLTSGGVIHYSPTYDITKDVITRLNKALPKMKLEFPVKDDGRAPARKPVLKPKPAQ